MTGTIAGGNAPPASTGFIAGPPPTPAPGPGDIFFYDSNGNLVGYLPAGSDGTLSNAESLLDNYTSFFNPLPVVADPPPVVLVGPGTYTSAGTVVNITTTQTLLASGGPAVTTLVDTGGFYTFGVNITADGVQVGNLSGEGFTIEATSVGGAAVQILGSNATLEGNILSANDSSGDAEGADLVTGSSANNLLINGNTFAGTGFALAYVNGALDTYTASQSVDFIDNSFTGTATAGADIADDAASGTISGNSFTGSGNQAIFLGGLSKTAADFYNSVYGTTYVSVPGTVTVSGNDFSHWTGADISTFNASYTFAHGGAGASLDETITASGREVDTLGGYLKGDQIAVDGSLGLVAMGVLRNGKGEADVFLSSGDEIVVQGDKVSAHQIAEMVGAPVLHGQYVQIPSNATGDLGQVGGNGPTIVDGSATNGVTFSTGNGPDTVFAGNNDTIKLGNGGDTLWLMGNGNTASLGNGPDLVEVLGNDNTVTGGHGPESLILAGTGNHVSLSNGLDFVDVQGGTNTIVGGTGPEFFQIAAAGPINLTFEHFSTHSAVVDLTPGTGVPHSFGQVLADMTQTGTGAGASTLLSYAGHSIDFVGTQKSAFHADNFAFV